MRLADLQPADMTDAQRRVAERSAAGKRGRIPAPLRAWLHSPEMGDRAQHLGEFLRYDTSLGPYLSELAILVTARFWTSNYEWFAHKGPALAAGLALPAIEAIAQQRAPELPDDRARLVYDYALTLHRARTITNELHDRAVSLLGAAGVVELVGVLGYYTLVAMTLNAFDIGLPDGEINDFVTPTQPGFNGNTRGEKDGC